jgi:hypothetical protein
VREIRFPARGVFYFTAETRDNCIVRFVFSDVNRRKHQFALNEMDVSSPNISTPVYLLFILNPLFAFSKKIIFLSFVSFELTGHLCVTPSHFESRFYIDYTSKK